ncbi:hypothetical protein DL768_005381 [Monosporascus sp. mg162]|nr:hypothetical protein DL768_005381 [Monosporascus sp. mg162]
MRDVETTRLQRTKGILYQLADFSPLSARANSEARRYVGFAQRKIDDLLFQERRSPWPTLAGSQCRGILSASVEEPVGNGNPSSGHASPPVPRQTYAINARGMAVVAALFHDPRGGRRAPLLLWGDFEAMMESLGFELRNGDGSRRTFVPRTEAWARGWRRTTHFHEPRDEVPVRTARAWSRQLAEAYGWSFDTFVRR